MISWKHSAALYIRCIPRLRSKMKFEIDYNVKYATWKECYSNDIEHGVEPALCRYDLKRTLAECPHVDTCVD